MKENQFRIGNTITIFEKPRCWNSRLSKRNPLDLNYPFTGTIMDKNGSALLISGYGFDLEYIKNFKILSDEIY